MPTLRDADNRHLAALVAVVDEGTFANAADALGYTQSAVSQQISQLERAAGITLFDRPKGPRAAELTPAGRLVLEYARSTLARVEHIDDRLDLLRRGLAGRLEIGTFQSASAELLPNIIGRMRHAAPDVDVRLDETDDVEEQLHDVLTDHLDLAFTVDNDDDSRITIELLGHDPFVVLAPVDEVTTNRVTAEELNQRPLIGQPGTAVAQLLIDHRLIDAGVRPDYAFRFQNNAAVQSMVRIGMGWAVMPSLAVDRDDPGVAFVELDPPIPARAIQLIRRSGRTLPPAADQFRAIARDVAQELLTR